MVPLLQLPLRFPSAMADSPSLLHVLVVVLDAHFDLLLIPPNDPMKKMTKKAQFRSSLVTPRDVRVQAVPLIPLLEAVAALAHLVPAGLDPPSMRLSR